MAGENPIALFRRWYARAERARVPMPDACALATADTRARPSVRFVLLKAAGPEGFTFYTHSDSRKGRELERNRRAAMAFYWDKIGRQVRVEGKVVRVPPKEADAYWASRPRVSQLGGAVSRQSRPMPSMSALLARVHALAVRLRGRPVPRPLHWNGYRIVPDAIEFWTRGENRLHLRHRYARNRRRWKRVLLQP